MIKMIFLFLLLLLANFQNAFTQIPEFKEIQLYKGQNGAIDFSQLDFLKTELAKADIVLLGEPIHSPEYYDIKIQLVKYLHEQLDFDVLAFESGFYQMETANADIKKGEDISGAFENGLFPIWSLTDEFQKIYRYLDSLKTNEDPFEISGFDCQISATYASKRFVPELEATLIDRKVSFDRTTFDLLQSQFGNLETGRKGLTDNFHENSLQALTKLAESIESIPDLQIYHRSLINWIAHFGDLYHNKIFEKLRNGVFQGSDSNIRDSLMAMNMIFLLNDLYPGKKIIGWGANLHFSNDVSKLDTGSPDSKQFLGMGYHLKKKLGDRVFLLGITTNKNYPHTIENEFAKRAVDAAWISHGSTSKKVFSTALLGKPATGNWSAAVDGILYFNSSDNVSGTVLEKHFLKGKIINPQDGSAVSFASVSLEGTTVGVASDIDGKYFLKIDSTDFQKTLKVSCIGFKTKLILAKHLVENGNIQLIPETQVLNEVLVRGVAPDAKEILQLTIEKISDNYLQTPFNMEFYSSHTTIDTTENKSYTIESIFSSYYEGYHPSARKNYRILQKRERGDYFMKEKTHGMSQWPMWEVAFNDIFSNQSQYQIVALDGLDKIEPKLIGTQIYDGDTVFVIKYNYKVTGVVYISSKDYAIVKHVVTSEGRGFKNTTEIVYRNQNGKYYPYAAKGDYLHEYKVDGIRKIIKISNQIWLNRIELKDVIPFEHDQAQWAPRNVSYNKTYWDANFPEKD